MFGDPILYEKNHQLVELDEICKKITDGEHGTVERLDFGFLYLMARNITKNGLIDLSDISYISKSDHDRIYKRCGAEENDILLVCVGATIGKVALVPNMESFSLARSVALIKPNKKMIEPLFLLSLFRSEWMQRKILSSGNTSAQAGLYLGKIKKMLVPLPPIALQREFAERVQATEGLKAKLKVSLAQADEQFNALSQRAFAGEL